MGFNTYSKSELLSGLQLSSVRSCSGGQMQSSGELIHSSLSSHLDTVTAQSFAADWCHFGPSHCSSLLEVTHMRTD